MLYVKSPELKNLGIDAAEVFEQLAIESSLRDASGAWHLGVYCYAYSDTLRRCFIIEDMEPRFTYEVGRLLRVSPVH